MLIDLSYIKNKYNLNITGIIHFGAHLAEEFSIYESNGIDNVMWFEANPVLAKHVADLSCVKIKGQSVYNQLMSDEDNVECDFYVTNNGQSSSMLKLARHLAYYPDITVSDTIKLKTKRFDTFSKENSIDASKYNFLNLDVQGAELKVIKGFGNLLNGIDYIYAEINEEYLYSGCALVGEIDEYLAGFGFSRVETTMTDKSWGDAFYIKNKGKKTLIVSHIMPTELEMFREMTFRLKIAAGHLTESDNVTQLYTLNLSDSVVDWANSSLTKEFFKEQFAEIILQNCWWSEVIIDITEDASILGTTAQKRRVIKDYSDKVDQFIFLDSDIYFHEYTLKYLLEYSKLINNDNYIITPQTVKLWDYTWDAITNEKFLNESYGFEKTFDPKEVLKQSGEDVGLREIQEFKFGCGWFTLYSKSLWQFVGIPECLGSYGSEDTYLMFACYEMRKKGFDVKQYVLDGLYIAEDYKYRPNPYKNNVKYLLDKNSIYVNHNSEKFIKSINEFSANLAL